MAAQIGATLFFTDHNQSAGWSETHYSVSGQDLPTVLKDAQDMAKARVMMLGAGISLDYIRVSDQQVRGDSLVALGIPPSQQNPIAYNKALIVEATVVGEGGRTVSPTSDYSFTALLCRMEMGVSQRKSLYLRGIPDSLDQDGGVITDSVFLDAFNSWVDLMKSGKWGARVLNKDLTANPIFPITSVTNNAGPPQQVTITAAGSNFQTGQSVRISGIKYQAAPPAAASTPINGVWQVANPQAGSFQLSGYPGGTVQYFYGGSVRARTYTVPAYSNVLQIRMVSRRAGRPFGLSKGRRKRYKAYH